NGQMINRVENRLSVVPEPTRVALGQTPRRIEERFNTQPAIGHEELRPNKEDTPRDETPDPLKPRVPESPRYPEPAHTSGYPPRPRKCLERREPLTARPCAFQQGARYRL